MFVERATTIDDRGHDPRRRRTDRRRRRCGRVHSKRSPASGCAFRNSAAFTGRRPASCRRSMCNDPSPVATRIRPCTPSRTEPGATLARTGSGSATRWRRRPDLQALTAPTSLGTRPGIERTHLPVDRRGRQGPVDARFGLVDLARVGGARGRLRFGLDPTGRPCLDRLDDGLRAEHGEGVVQLAAGATWLESATRASTASDPCRARRPSA